MQLNKRNQTKSSEGKTCNLEAFDVPADYRVKMKESVKIGKYLDLTREMKKVRNPRVTLMPVGEFGTVPKGFERKLRKLEIRGRIETI